MGKGTGRVAGKRAIVTGAGSGIGRATAILFAREGARVGLISRRESMLREVESVIAEEGGESLVLPCDVSKQDQVAGAFAAVEERWGGVDACVAVAGIERWAEGDDRVDRLELAVWQEIIDINLTGMFLTLKCAVRAMLKIGGGAIVVTGSPTGLYGFAAGENAYSASKAGCHGLARVLANEVAPEHIRVNIVVPGFIEAGVNEKFMRENPQGVEDYCRATPMRRIGQPEEVAPMNLFLCTDEASFTTGGYFVVDGGYIAI